MGEILTQIMGVKNGRIDFDEKNTGSGPRMALNGFLDAVPARDPPVSFPVLRRWIAPAGGEFTGLSVLTAVYFFFGKFRKLYEPAKDGEGNRPGKMVQKKRIFRKFFR